MGLRENVSNSNVIYCISWALCNKLHIGETERWLGDRFREHLLDVRNNSKHISKPVAQHCNLPSQPVNHMTVSGISLHCGTTDSRRRKEHSLIFKIGTLAPNGINERFSIFQFCKYQHRNTDTYKYVDTFKYIGLNRWTVSWSPG